MVPRHAADEVAGDGERGEHGAQGGQRGEEETRGALGVLSDREEPLHQGVLTAPKLLPIRYETIKQTQAGCSSRRRPCLTGAEALLRRRPLLAPLLLERLLSLLLLQLLRLRGAFHPDLQIGCVVR